MLKPKWNKFLLFAFLTIALSFVTMASAQSVTWEFVGNRNISGASSNYAVLISDAAGTPYVLFNDGAVGGKASVMSYDGTSWNFVGPQGFSNAPVTQRGDIAIDDSGNIWVITVGDLNANDNLEVWKFDGTSWSEVGPAKDRTGIEPKIEFNNGQPYIVFREGFTSGWGISVMAYDGSSWNYVGSPSFTAQISSYPSLAFYNNDPYVAYADRDQGFRTSVKKYDGTSWEFVGTPGFTTASGGGSAFWSEIEISQSGVPHVMYVDGNIGSAGDSGLNVMKFNGSSWVHVGAVNFAKAFWPELAFDGDTPYVGFENIGTSQGRGGSVVTFNGASWEYVGDEVFTPFAFGTNFDISNGTLRIAFLDFIQSSGTSVMELASAVSDSDGDGVADDVDNCPSAANPGQEDLDGDGVGDACDPDRDGDGVDNSSDAFPDDPTESVDTDGDGIGNNADSDDDNDGQSDADEIACGSDPLDAASLSPDNDGDSSPDCVDPDDDNDGVADGDDNCPTTVNADQSDYDNDGLGDVCDSDDDNDGVADGDDAFPFSDTAATVVIDGCESGVDNQTLASGATFNDLIGQAAANAGNHGDFVSAVSSLSNDWKKDGLISGRDKGKITSCAARSDIP